MENHEYKDSHSRGWVRLHRQMNGSAGPIASAGTGVDIGFGSDGSFIGIIDEVALYNRALDDDEVMQNYKSKVFFAVDYQDKLAVCWGKVKGK